MKRISVIYDSRSGHTSKMADAVAEGILEAGGVEAIVKTIETAEPADLLADGVIIGSPVHCGLPSWKIKKFFDDHCGAVWGKVEGRIGAAFSSSGGLGGGNELTAMGILNMLINYGYVVFGLPEYTAPGVTAHYGAVAVGVPGENELAACRLLGKRAAGYVKRMNPPE